MQQHKAISDPVIGQIYELMGRLQECLIDGAQIRARLTKARQDGNNWPDVEGALARLVSDRQPPRGH
jgi:hypothetical protein